MRDLIKSFGLAREVLRSPLSKQAGAGADQIVLDNPDHISFFFLDGDQHRKRRTAFRQKLRDRVHLR
jgi:cytochrome P450